MKAGDLCLVGKLTRADMMAAERLFESWTISGLEMDEGAKSKRRYSLILNSKVALHIVKMIAWKVQQRDKDQNRKEETKVDLNSWG